MSTHPSVLWLNDLLLEVPAPPNNAEGEAPLTFAHLALAGAALTRYCQQRSTHTYSLARFPYAKSHIEDYRFCPETARLSLQALCDQRRRECVDEQRTVLQSYRDTQAEALLLNALLQDGYFGHDTCEDTIFTPASMAVFTEPLADPPHYAVPHCSATRQRKLKLHRLRLHARYCVQRASTSREGPFRRLVRFHADTIHAARQLHRRTALSQWLAQPPEVQRLRGTRRYRELCGQVRGRECRSLTRDSYAAEWHSRAHRPTWTRSCC